MTLFMRKQGFPTITNIFYQDNESAVKIEKNGRKSCSSKSRHLNVRFFFIKDHLERNNIQITYCKSEAMIAHFFTKPIHGSLFIKMRNIIMGLSSLMSKKCVEVNNDGSNEFTKSLRKKEDKRN